MSHVTFSSANYSGLDRLMDSKNRKHSAGLLIRLIDCKYNERRITVLATDFEAINISLIKLENTPSNKLTNEGFF
ncbi:MAG: hypothetical protein EBZ95_04920 [Chitinophagia bacterium]|jgi:hypothetical protein|nr:hypothetical protein [Chitinophagia bacterium]